MRPLPAGEALEGARHHILGEPATLIGHVQTEQLAIIAGGQRDRATAITMLPALAILATTTNATSALVLSQVVLSFGIPFALVPLVVLTSRAQIMGGHVNRRCTTICACACVAVIIALNVLIVVHEA